MPRSFLHLCVPEFQSTLSRVPIRAFHQATSRAPPHHAPRSRAALTYFVLYMLHEFQNLHDRVHNDSAPGSPPLRGALAAAEALFAAWTALALRATLSHLRAKGAGVRLLVFRIFAGVLTVVAAACLIYLAFEAYVHATHPVYDKWQLEWVSPPSCVRGAPSCSCGRHTYRGSVGKWFERAAVRRCSS